MSVSTSQLLLQTEVFPAVSDPERLAVLEQTGLLTCAPDPMLDRVARLAAAVVGTPMSFVCMVGLDRQVMPGAAELDGGAVRREVPIAESVCQYAVATGDLLVIPDARQDPLVRKYPSVIRSEMLAYAGIPLSTAQGHVLGTLCVLDRRPREWDEGQLELLRDLAGLVELEIEHRLAAGRILGVQGLARRVADSIDALGDSLTSLVRLAEQQEAPRLQRYAAVTGTRFDHVGELARDLRAASVPEQVRSAASRPQVVDLRQAVQRAVNTVCAVTQSDGIRTVISPISLPIRCDPLLLERSVGQLVLIALHNSGADPRVKVQLAATDDPACADQDPLFAELTVTAQGSHVPAAELARVVARLQAATCEDAGGEEAPARISVAGGIITARSGTVYGRSSPDGSTFHVRWRLDVEPHPATIMLP